MKINHEGKEIFVCAKMDLQMDLVRDYRRPRYHYEAGKLQFGDFETDANNLFAEIKDGSMNYIAVNTVKLSYKKQAIFEQKFLPYGLGFDGQPDRLGRGKVRYWKDKVKLVQDSK